MNRYSLRARRSNTAFATMSQIREGMRISVLDGVFAVPYVNITAGTLLTGFLLALGASTAQIGFVSMLPLAGGLIQPVGAHLIRRHGGWRKPIVVTSVILDDLLWAVTLVAVFALPPRTALLAAITVLALQQTITAVITVAWTSWMSDLVPASLRGRYFGRRNFVCNAVGAVAAVLAGQFVARIGGAALWSFATVIVVAMLFRLVSAILLARQPELTPEKPGPGRLRDHFTVPFSNEAFRHYAQFGLAWGFAVHIASPFFAVYMLVDLQMDLGVVMVLAALSISANLAGQRFWGTVSDRYSHLQVMKIAVLVVVLQPVWWLFASDSGLGFFVIVLAHLVGGFTWGGYQLASGNLMMALVPATGKSSFFGTQAALSGVAGAAGPIVGGLLADGLLKELQIPVLGRSAALPALFFVSFVLRLASWTLLSRIDEPTKRPRLRIAYLIGDALRTSNQTQGFDPLLHRAFESADDDRPLEEALERLATSAEEEATKG